MESRDIKIRDAHVREVVGKKVVKDKLYTYTYYTLPLNIYIPKHIVERYGQKYKVVVNRETGVILLYPEGITCDKAFNICKEMSEVCQYSD